MDESNSDDTYILDRSASMKYVLFSG